MKSQRRVVKGGALRLDTRGFSIQSCSYSHSESLAVRALKRCRVEDTGRHSLHAVCEWYSKPLAISLANPPLHALLDVRVSEESITPLTPPCDIDFVTEDTTPPTAARARAARLLFLPYPNSMGRVLVKPKSIMIPILLSSSSWYLLLYVYPSSLSPSQAVRTRELPDFDPSEQFYSLSEQNCIPTPHPEGGEGGGGAGMCCVFLALPCSVSRRRPGDRVSLICLCVCVRSTGRTCATGRTKN